MVTFEIERDFSRIARLKTGNVRRYLGSVFGNILLAVVRSHYTFYEAAMFPKQNECLYLTCTVLQLVSYIYIFVRLNHDIQNSHMKAVVCLHCGGVLPGVLWLMLHVSVKVATVLVAFLGYVDCCGCRVY